MPKYARLLICGWIAVTSIAVAAHADPVQEIRGSLEQLERALNAGDLDAVARLYAGDAVVIPTESEILHNQESIRAFWHSQIAAGADTYRFDLVDLQVQADRAYLSTLWSATVNTRDERVVTFEGNLANVLERQPDGSWKIRMQSWN